MEDNDHNGNSNNNNKSNVLYHPPSLSNLVVANSSQEIVTIVSTLAKCYGHRLRVATAKRVANVTATATAATQRMIMLLLLRVMILLHFDHITLLRHMNIVYVLDLILDFG
jgi:hypothetical protein